LTQLVLAAPALLDVADNLLRDRFFAHAEEKIIIVRLSVRAQ
jgi:hypothetical protein